MKTPKNSQDSEMLTHNQAAMLAKLTTELHVLNRHRFVRIHNAIWRLLTFNFMRGFAFGFGSVIGGDGPFIGCGLLVGAVRMGAIDRRLDGTACRRDEPETA